MRAPDGLKEICLNGSRNEIWFIQAGSLQSDLSKYLVSTYFWLHHRLRNCGQKSHDTVPSTTRIKSLHVEICRHRQVPHLYREIMWKVKTGIETIFHVFQKLCTTLNISVGEAMLSIVVIHLVTQCTGVVKFWLVKECILTQKIIFPDHSLPHWALRV